MRTRTWPGPGSASVTSSSSYVPVRSRSTAAVICMLIYRDPPAPVSAAGRRVGSDTVPRGPVEDRCNIHIHPVIADVITTHPKHIATRQRLGFTVGESV